jgi:hypothetical protein
VISFPPTNRRPRGNTVTHDVDLSETAIHHRVRALLTTQGIWQDGNTELLAYLGLARTKTLVHGHVQYRIHRLPLISMADPGIERLMLSDALMDNLSERHAGVGLPLPGIFLS